MDWRETVSVAVDALRANKVRAMLTSLGVIIGSASIVLVVTVALTSKKFVLSQIESIGSNLVWVERSEEHTSELQSRPHLVCRLLLEKKKSKSPHSVLHNHSKLFHSQCGY